jgi:hypothetical protein
MCDVYDWHVGQQQVHVLGLVIFKTGVYDRQQWMWIIYLSRAMPRRIALAYIQ